MTKKEMADEIERLKRRVSDLEARPPVIVPYAVPYQPPAPMPSYPVPYWQNPITYGYPPGTILC